MKAIAVYFILLIYILTSCKKLEDQSMYEEILVLQAYLFQNEPVEGIRLSKTVSFESEDTTYYLITDADIIIGWNDNEFKLENDENGYYYYPYDDREPH